ncbi:MAG: hypothetical protein ACI4EF_12090 [Coprococcus sp.]
MKKLKNVLALSLLFIFAYLITACADNNITKEGKMTDKENMMSPDNEIYSENLGNPAPLTIPEANSNVIYVYSWNDELDDRIQYFRKKYPELSKLVKYVNLDMDITSDEYIAKIEKLLSKGTDAKKYPSIFVADASQAKYILSSDLVMPIEELGITDDMLTDMYSYTIDYATIDGSLKGLAWQISPGCFYYRADIAREVLGTDEPEAVQTMVNDWDSFFDVAVQMKEAGYFMISGRDNLKEVCLNQSETKWVDNDVLSMPEGVKLYMQYAKKCTDEGYEAGTSFGTDSWASNVNKNVFAYFDSADFLYKTLAENSDDTVGEWRICKGPADYNCGGTYIGIGNDTPNKELAALVLYTLCCDTDVMEQIAANEFDYVNNKKAIQNILNKGTTASEMLRGQKPFEIWNEVAENSKTNLATIYDAYFNAITDKVVNLYAKGDIKTIDDAIMTLNEQIAVEYTERKKQHERSE